MINSFVFKTNYTRRYPLVPSDGGLSGEYRYRFIELLTMDVVTLYNSLSESFDINALSHLRIENVLCLRGTNSIAITKNGKIYQTGTDDILKRYKPNICRHVLNQNYNIFGDILEVALHYHGMEDCLKVNTINCPVLPNINSKFRNFQKLMVNFDEDQYLRPIRRNTYYESSQI